MFNNLVYRSIYICFEFPKSPPIHTAPQEKWGFQGRGSAQGADGASTPLRQLRAARGLLVAALGPRAEGEEVKLGCAAQSCIHQRPRKIFDIKNIVWSENQARD